jgi:hypothetical protein
MSPDAEEIWIQLFSGRGNLDARALWASIVGRYRLAHGEKSFKQLSLAKGSIQVARNIGSAGVYQLVGISLPAGAPVDPVPVVFSSQSITGTNTGIPVRLTAAMGQQDVGGPVVGGGSYMAVLQPGDELYAVIAPGGPATLSLVVTQVSF